MVDSPGVNMYGGTEALLSIINAASQKGELTSALQRKVRADPSCSPSLIDILLSELEKKQKRREIRRVPQSRVYMSIIPVLHTLSYAILQSGVMIPNELYQRVCACLTKLLILPLPYSSVVLKTLRSATMEMNTPGSLYLRRLIGEQSLRNKHFNLHERVFVLAANEDFSAPLQAIYRAYSEVSGLSSRTHELQKKAVRHVLHSGLDIHCSRNQLAQALESLNYDQVEKHFHEVVLAVKESMKRGAGGHADHLNTLQEIYNDITTASEEEKIPVGDGAACSATMPYPQIVFPEWKNEEDLWNLLAKFAFPVDTGRKSQQDSGIKPDINKTSSSEKQRFERVKVYKNSKQCPQPSMMCDLTDGDPGSSAVVHEKQSHTARVVVLGDDRVLGRLAKAWHYIRKKESKRVLLTKKLNLQFYYIPITKVKSSCQPTNRVFREDDRFSLASYLRLVDPWYSSNICNLEDGLFKLSATPSSPGETTAKNQDLLDTLCYYIRCGTLPVNLQLYSVKLVYNGPEGRPEEESVFVSHLRADINDFRHLRQSTLGKTSSKQKKPSHLGALMSITYTKTSLSNRNVVMGAAPMTFGVVVSSELAASTTGGDYLAVSFETMDPKYDTKIQAKTINIRTLEHYRLSVYLDRDPQRTYTDVQRIEIFPCLDPGCTIKPKVSSSFDQKLPRSKYLDKVLSLPINTFTGVTI